MPYVDVRVTHAQFCAAPNLLDPKADVSWRKSTFPTLGEDDWTAIRIGVDPILVPLIDPAPRVAFQMWATSYLRIRLNQRTLLVDEPLRYSLHGERRLAHLVRVRYGEVSVQFLPADPFPMFQGLVRLRFEALAG